MNRLPAMINTFAAMAKGSDSALVGGFAAKPAWFVGSPVEGCDYLRHSLRSARIDEQPGKAPRP